MKNLIFKYALVLIFLSLSLQTANSQQEYLIWSPELKQLEGYKSSFTVVLSPEDYEKMKNLWNEIGEDLKTEQNAFAGTFAETGYGSGYFIRWSTKKGFILIPYFDQHLIVDFSFGKAEITEDSEIILIPEQEMKGRGRRFLKTPRVWIPVKNAEFLVYKEQIQSFGNYYGGFGEFNGFPRKRFCDECGTFARRAEDRKDAAIASFIAPPKYLKFIKKPIEAQITFVGKRRITRSIVASCCGFEAKSSATPVLINAGRKKGVTKSLLFLLVDAGSKFDQVLKITRVDEKFSEGIVFRVLDENGKENYEEFDAELKSDVSKPFPLIRVGTRVTTSPVSGN